MRINEDFIKVNTGDDTAIVPTGDGYQNGVFILNETAERIFDLLSEGKDRDEIVAILCEEYETDRSVLSIQSIWDFITTFHIPDLKKLFDWQIGHNMSIAEEGLAND